MPTVTRHPPGEGAGAARESGPPRHDPATPTRRSRSARWMAWYAARAPVFVSRVAAVLGLLTVTDALWPHRRLINALGTFLPTPARATAEALVVVSGVLLLRIAAGLRRRKRGEWQIAVLICVVLTAANLVGEDRRPVEAVVTVVLLAALLVARERFTAKPDPRSRWFAMRVSVQFLAVAVIYGMALTAMPRTLPFRRGRAPSSRPAELPRSPRLSRVLRATARQVDRLVRHRQGRDRLPRRVRGRPGQRRPDR